MLFREHVIQPSPPRATVFDDGGRLRIVIPPPRHWFIVLFLAVWSVGWALALVSTLRGIVVPAHAGSEVQWFSIVWLCGWTAAGSWVLYSLLYMLFGREVVRIDEQLLTIANQAPIYTRLRRFGLGEVRELRVSPDLPQHARWGGGWSVYGGLGGYEGPFAFDYGARTYRFGAGVDEAEAKQLLAVIVERFPSLASPAG